MIHHLAAVEDVAVALFSRSTSSRRRRSRRLARLAPARRRARRKSASAGFLASRSLAADAADLVDRLECAPERPTDAEAREISSHGDDVGQVAHVAAVLRHGGHAEQADVAELLPQVGREQVVAVDLRRARRDLGGGETACTVSRRASISAPR